MQRFRRAKNTLGASPDMVRTFGETMMEWANKLANLEYMPEIDGAYTEIRGAKYLQEKPSDPSPSTIKAMKDEISSREGFIKSPFYNPAVSFMASMAYNMFLLGNISSAIINLTALPLMAAPILGAEYGYTTTARS